MATVEPRQSRTHGNIDPTRHRRRCVSSALSKCASICRGRFRRDRSSESGCSRRFLPQEEFRYAAPQRYEDSRLQMRVASFSGMPMVLASPLNPSTPLAKHISANLMKGPIRWFLISRSTRSLRGSSANRRSGLVSQSFGYPAWGETTHGSGSAAGYNEVPRRYQRAIHVLDCIRL